MSQTIRQFVRDAYSLINPGSPTQTLHGDDQSRAIAILNRLLAHQSTTGLLDTIDKEVTFNIVAGTQTVTFGDSASGADVTEGYLNNIYTAYITLGGTDYALNNISRAIFNESYKYGPLTGLPRFYFLDNSPTLSTMRLYPGAAQAYDLKVSGKFAKTELTSNDTTAILPDYSLRFYQLALARDLAFYKGRSSAWTPELQALYKEASDTMIAQTPVNLKVYEDYDTMLNGAARVRAGI